MQTFVIDSSVLVKPVLGEEGQQKVKKIFFLKENYQISVLVPDIFRYEFFNTVTREISSGIAKDAYRTITLHQLSIIPLETDLIEKTTQLVTKYQGISFYDATFHALAAAYHVILITADKKYYQKTRAEGNVRLLEDLKI